jgi:carbon-monoxide dehydrogenase small subunit
MEYRLSLTVNGVRVTRLVEPQVLLLDFLREELGLTGAKEGCGTGDCGACTVMIDGKPQHSCLTLAVEAEGREVTTVEGLVTDGMLNEVQSAFVQYGATQCGICTPGFVVMSTAFLRDHPKPSEEELRMGIAGNLCRCTGYDSIVKALQAVVAGKVQRIPVVKEPAELVPDPEGE